MIPLLVETKFTDELLEFLQQQMVRYNLDNDKLGELFFNFIPIFAQEWGNTIKQEYFESA